MPSIEQLFTSAQRSGPFSELPIVGVNTHIFRGSTRTSTEENVAAAKQMGAQMVRVDAINWNVVESVKGSYVWPADAMELISRLRAEGIKVNLILGYNNPLYAKSWGAACASPANIAAYANYCVAAARQFTGDDIVLSFRNEPNIPMWWEPKVDGVEVGRMLAATVNAVRADKPNAILLSPGYSNIGGPDLWTPYLKTIQATAGPVAIAKLTGHAFHTYNQGDLVNQSPETAMLHLDAFRAATGAANIWNEEWGYPLEWTSNSRERQGIFIQRSILTSMAFGTKCHLHYDLFDDGTDMANGEHTYGLFDHAMKIKPAGIAFKAMTDAIKGATAYQFKFDAAQQLCSFVFKKPGGNAAIVWTYTAGRKSYADSEFNISDITEAGGPVIVDKSPVTKPAETSPDAMRLAIAEFADGIAMAANAFAKKMRA